MYGSCNFFFHFYISFIETLVFAMPGQKSYLENGQSETGDLDCHVSQTDFVGTAIPLDVDLEMFRQCFVHEFVASVGVDVYSPVIGK